MYLMQGEIHDLREVAEQLESEHLMLGKKMDRTEKELKIMTKQWQDSVETIAELKEKIDKLQQTNKTASQDHANKLASQERKFTAREQELKEQVDAAKQTASEAGYILEEVTASKVSLDQQLFDARVKMSDDKQLRHRLAESENRRQLLETRAQKLAMMEEREEDLERQLSERSNHCKELLFRVTELEDRADTREREYVSSEELYKMRQKQDVARIKYLDVELEELRSLKVELEDQSQLEFEENEKRLRTIQNQEAIIESLKSSMEVLEEKVQQHRKDLQTPHTPRRISTGAHHLRSMSVEAKCGESKKIQGELDTLKIESRKKQTTLQEERDDLKAEVATYTSHCQCFRYSAKINKKSTKKHLETAETSHQSQVDDLEQQVKTAQQKLADVQSHTEQLNRDVCRLNEEKTKLKIQHDKVCSELLCMRHEHDQAVEKFNKLKEECGELNAQLTDYETRDTKWKQEKSVYEKTIDEQGDEMKRIRKELSIEKQRNVVDKQTRQELEEKNNELKRMVASLEKKCGKGKSAFSTELVGL